MIFFMVSTLLVFLVHVYLWRRLVHDTALGKTFRRAATWLLFGLFLSIPLSFHLRGSAQHPLLWIGNIWLGLMFYLAALLAAWDVIRLGLWAIRQLKRLAPAGAAAGAASGGVSSRDAQPGDAAPQPLEATPQGAPELPRRVFLARTSAAMATVASGSIGLLGARAALWEITTPDVVVKLPRLPRALEGYTIALMSDIHIGATLDGRFMRHLVEQANHERPDLVAIVGDLVDGTVSALGPHVAELQRLRARHGTVFVTGNHEYYSGAEPWIDFLRRLGVRVLLNEHLSVGDLGTHGAQFDVAGVPDHHAHHFDSLGADPQAAIVGRDPERALVMLAHQPAQIVDVASTRADLQLSGHTHGGQLFPFGALTALVQPYLAGLYRHNEDTQIYVSRGTGFWGPPMRVLAPAEITRIRLIG